MGSSFKLDYDNADDELWRMMSAPIVRVIKTAALLFAGWTAFGVLSSAHFFFAENGAAQFRDLADNVIVFYWGWALLTPAVIYAARRYTISGGISVRSASLLVASAVAVTVAHGVLHLGLTALFGVDGHKHLDASGLSAYLVRHGGGDLATFAVIAGGVFLIEEKRRRSARDAANAALEARLARTDLELLRWQLHPHFLFNALNTVSTLVLQQETERAERAITLISRYLRAALDQRPDTTVRLGDELERVERYIEIERMRFGDSVRFEAQMTDAALDARVPGELIQPLVENAIVHGTVRDNGAGPIVMRTQVEGGRLRLSIVNPTSLPLSGENGKGFGLRYVRERLAQFYGSDAQFTLGADESNAVATLDIPYSTEARGAA